MGLFLVNEMQTPPPLKKSRFNFLIQVVEKRSETDEKRKIKIPIFFSYDRFCSQFSSVSTDFFFKKNQSNDAQCNVLIFAFMSFFVQ